MKKTPQSNSLRRPCLKQLWSISLSFILVNSFFKIFSLAFSNTILYLILWYTKTHFIFSNYVGISHFIIKKYRKKNLYAAFNCNRQRSIRLWPLFINSVITDHFFHGRILWCCSYRYSIQSDRISGIHNHGFHPLYGRLS